MKVDRTIGENIGILWFMLIFLLLISASSLISVCAQDEFEGGGFIYGMVFGFDINDEVVPLSWAKITVEKDGVVFTTVYSSEGYYEVAAPGGDVTVTVEHGGYITRIEHVYVSGGSSTAMNFYLERSEKPIPEFPAYTYQLLMAVAVLSALLLSLRLKRRSSKK